MVRTKIEQFSSKVAALNRRKCNIDPNKIFLSSFIVELLECVKMFQPVSRADLLELYKTIKGFSSFIAAIKEGTCV